MKAVSFQGSIVGWGFPVVSGLLYSKKGIGNGSTNLPTPNPIEAMTTAIARAVNGRTLMLKEIPSLPIIFAHHFFI